MKKNDVVTAPGLMEMKLRGEKISVLTAYDYAWGRLIDEAGIDVALVGDSLGMVVLGYETTLQVTMEDMVRHTAAVARGAKRAMVVADMPFLSYQVDDDAIMNAGRLVVEGGAKAVKLEGGGEVAEIVEKIVNVGIPVWGHIGMTPQSVHQLGGYRMQGKDADNAERIKREALELQEAGACAIVLELIPAQLAKEITASLEIPTIGIGAGPHCDGQVLVTHDVLGLYDRFVPSFAKRYANLWQITLKAFKAYNEDVKRGRFPVK
ncbi:MAG: 3-methyl-2-oxobutanoate hydroxymethyltransferase [Armatimonadetes bacterium]|nr:3-methyl-2-oxobutanoate hydroxymethyltransferase [Armatimonadota bacterium]